MKLRTSLLLGGTICQLLKRFVLIREDIIIGVIFRNEWDDGRNGVPTPFGDDES